MKEMKRNKELYLQVEQDETYNTFSSHKHRTSNIVRRTVYSHSILAYQVNQGGHVCSAEF